MSTTEENCLNPLTVLACGLGYRTLGLKAATIHIVLTGTHSPSSPEYVGAPR